MKAAMAAFLISLLMGLLVLGEQALVMAKAHFSAPSAQHMPKEQSSDR
jgi:hypothetical protein